MESAWTIAVQLFPLGCGCTAVIRPLAWGSCAPSPSAQSQACQRNAPLGGRLWLWLRLRRRLQGLRTSTGTRLKAGVPLSASITARINTLASG